MSKKIKMCPLCHYLGEKGEEVCPHCGVKLISNCPNCGALIRTPFAEYCAVCGINFKKEIRIKHKE